ncbi:hypothetical protein [Allofranklinella schreckenbergeri]|uniref:hypothetical protein n=1 Tax=Allofranklinella schreckenbergeri TaxID=1076744 RepID=UPI0011C402E4|nr:hypothetical protein [Allofranklinella schreckenbergeri]
MKPVESSSFAPLSRRSLADQQPDRAGHADPSQAFGIAINALTMARYHLLQGDERTAERKACAALQALRQIVPASELQFNT